MKQLENLCVFYFVIVVFSIDFFVKGYRYYHKIVWIDWSLNILFCILNKKEVKWNQDFLQIVEKIRTLFILWVLFLRRTINWVTIYLDSMDLRVERCSMINTFFIYLVFGLKLSGNIIKGVTCRFLNPKILCGFQTKSLQNLQNHKKMYQNP